MAKHTSKNHYVIEPMYETLEKLIEIHIEKGEINPLYPHISLLIFY